MTEIPLFSRENYLKYAMLTFVKNFRCVPSGWDEGRSHIFSPRPSFYDINNICTKFKKSNMTTRLNHIKSILLLLLYITVYWKKTWKTYSSFCHLVFGSHTPSQMSIVFYRWLVSTLYRIKRAIRSDYVHCLRG